VEAHGGTVFAQEAEGGGASVGFELPAEDSSDEETEAEEATEVTVDETEIEAKIDYGASEAEVIVDKEIPEAPPAQEESSNPAPSP